MRRPTIDEIASRAGVSKSAVSYALNHKPGVSEETRSRILRVADELSWQPSTAARALAGSRVGSIGLVLNRPASLLGFEPFYMEFISGAQEVLSARDYALVFKVANSLDDECATYRSWAASRKVDGVLLTDLTEDDVRPDLLRKLEIPTVMASQPQEANPDFVAVWTNDGDAIKQTVRYLAALGHIHIAHVSGTPHYLHSKVRVEAIRSEMKVLDLPEPKTITTDFSQEQGMNATRLLLSDVPRPTAIIYDNDVMAASGLGVATEMNVIVPDDLSIVAWDDSMLSRLVHPPLTSVSVNVRSYGMRVVQTLLAVIDGDRAFSGLGGSPGLVVRRSTGPAPKRA